MDFLEDWDAFVQKLSNIFGSYLPEDGDEDAVRATGTRLQENP